MRPTVRAIIVALFTSSVCSLPTASTVRGQGVSCFPFGSATFKGSLQAPNVMRKEWCCPQSMTYGFLGFSYPMEGECYDDSYARINAELQRQKRDFGANLIRVYLPYCYTTYIWENLILAAVANDMGIVAQVAWPLNGDPLEYWRLIAASILEVLFNSTYSEIAPYVFHSIEFGTEPIGDQDDGDNFINELKAFKAAVNPYGIPVGISEDWDRPGILCSNYTAGQAPGLGPVGKQILSQSDFVHAHIMPYYHGYSISGSWGYIADQVHWYKNYTPVPLVISETQWAWELNVLHQGSKDIGTQQYETFWHNYDAKCQFFKKSNVGWFLHSWKWEGTFNMVMPNQLLRNSELETTELLGRQERESYASEPRDSLGMRLWDVSVARSSIENAHSTVMWHGEVHLQSLYWQHSAPENVRGSVPTFRASRTDTTLSLLYTASTAEHAVHPCPCGVPDNSDRHGGKRLPVHLPHRPLPAKVFSTKVTLVDCDKAPCRRHVRPCLLYPPQNHAGPFIYDINIQNHDSDTEGRFTQVSLPFMTSHADYILKYVFLPFIIAGQSLLKFMPAMGNLPTPEPEVTSVTTSPASSSHSTRSTPIFHIVHFRFYTHIPPSQRISISHQFLFLKFRCLHPKTRKPYIRSFTGGTDVSIENLQNGYHTAFLLEFACREDRDWYVNEDQVHRGFGVESLTGVVEEVMVVDFRKGDF